MYTFGSIIECWFKDTTTSSISLSMRCSCGLMWNVSEKERGADLQILINYKKKDKMRRRLFPNVIFFIKSIPLSMVFVGQQ